MPVRLVLLVTPLLASLVVGQLEPGVPQATQEGPMAKILADFRNGDHAEAVEAAAKLAEQGDPDAFFVLGFAAETGQGAPLSREKALEFYQRAAEGGHLESKYRRALILLHSADADEKKQGRAALEAAAESEPGMAGRILGEAWLQGVVDGDRDVDQAIDWWIRSSESGDSTSDLLLARLYSGEFGFPEKNDPEKALQHIRKAAERGNLGAYVPLGSRLIESDEKSTREEGLKWLHKGIENGQTLGFLLLGAYQETQEKDLESAYQTFLTGAENGQPDCMLAVARFLIKGQGIGKNEAAGVEWLEKSAEAGNAHAHLELAGMLGGREKPDQSAIHQHLLFAAKADLPMAQNALALLYLADDLGGSDPVAAAAWLLRASKSGFAAAQFNLAALYEKGLGIEQNLPLATDLYSQAAGQGHAQATTALARMHAFGVGMKPDLSRAWTLAKIAIDRGDANASKLLETLDGQLTGDQLETAKADYKRLSAPSHDD
ncbi:secretory immunoglobulin A-binding protein EsiB [Haloferula sargassicola]|uniref:Secretory immunoglobulin A-binding protein EsiB n=2 Tax=Haloferula sargassicola TaxID=490096 RepID=A0ABP9URP7_9BACT